MNNYIKPKITNILLYSVIAVGYYLLISQYIRVHDDLIYSLKLDDGLPINSLMDILTSQCYGYTHQNGRFLLHFCTQFLCWMDSKIPFYLISTLCFVGLVAGCSRLACGQQFGFYAIPLFALLFILILPSPGATLYGLIAFVVNYLWTSCAIVWFLVVYFKNNHQSDALTRIILFVFSFVCGSLQESFSIGLCAGLIADFLINRNNRNKTKTLMSLGFLMGAMVCILAPGNFLRAQGSGFESSFVRRFILVLGEGWFVWVVLLFSIILFFLRRHKAIEFVKNNVILFVAILTNLAFAVVIAYTFKHQLFSQIMLSIVLFVGLIKSLDILFLKKWQTIVGIVALCAYLAMMFPIHSARGKLLQAYDSLVKQAEQQSNGVVCAKEYAALVNSPFADNFFARYTQLIAANSVIYSNDGIKYLSNYLERIKGVNQLKAVLPDSIENIASICTGDICSTDIYFVVKRHLDGKDFAIRLTEKPIQLFSKMLNRITNKDYRTKEIMFSNIQIKFLYQECEYGIIYRYLDNGYVITEIDNSCAID